MRNNKYVISLILFVMGLLLLVSPVSAAPDINGSGQEGSPTSKCGNDNPVCWYRVRNDYDGSVANDDGVRITLVSISENGEPLNQVGRIDYSNQNHMGEYYLSYGEDDGRSKIWYKLKSNYSDVLKFTANYQVKKPSSPIPWVVRASDGANNMNSVKEWFSTANAIEGIASDLGMPCSDATDPTKCALVSTYDNGVGKYKLLIEPIAYLQVKYDGLFYNVAVTPTQMAMFDSLDSKKPFYQGAPTMLYDTFAKAMFLQKSDLGFTAYTPSGGSQSMSTVKNYLGMAIISFDGELETPEEDGPIDVVVDDFSYRVNTDVYSNFKISSGTDRAKDNPISYKMILSSTGQVLCSDTVEVPAGKEQLVWCKWTTPSRKGTDTIKVYADGIYQDSMDITIGSLDKLDPPDTNADDKKPNGWTLKSIDEQLNDSKLWSVWYSVKQTDITAGGNNVGWDYTKVITYRYTWHPGTSGHCSISGNGNKTDCVAAGGSWTNGTSGYYSQNGSTTSYENNKYYYKFYQFGSHQEVSQSCTGSHSNGNRVCRYNYEGIENTSKPFKDTFTVKLSSSTELDHDVNNKTVKNDVMKSGYGVSLKTKNTLTANRTSTGGYGGSGKTAEVTGIQTGVASYPEFKYNTYFTLLDGTTLMQLPKNNASVTKERVHFTPIWYPDNKKYPIKVRVLDVWTPAGMLNTTTSDYKMVKGNMWEDVQIVGGR